MMMKIIQMEKNSKLFRVVTVSRGVASLVFIQANEDDLSQYRVNLKFLLNIRAIESYDITDISYIEELSVKDKLVKLLELSIINIDYEEI